MIYYRIIVNDGTIILDKHPIVNWRLEDDDLKVNVICIKDVSSYKLVEHEEGNYYRNIKK